MDDGLGRDLYRFTVGYLLNIVGHIFEWCGNLSGHDNSADQEDQYQYTRCKDRPDD